ncbi:peptidyl-tRNA hydrolase PTH2 [Fadolivirus algeromassiliense]|jgi:peptidyl-tRNA hydrolase|uniref:peptidyl-tRNA hydrolase n=1 Tax=Fadolivirus FV1/VV64 TaxID=3070911 RepID=A0A7D3V640_9VIRU|nr:peptidyl-tRNA hydrolase PTH2 [Fadolivirus algeromassiliense]QKF94815.1 peptidyl-tRNA hydrolase PTH2 [Fadolivirus FV1/VV64]
MAEQAPIFYIFINQDLGMSKGGQLAQVVHITQIIVEDLVKKCYETYPPSKECMMYMKWKAVPTTVVLKATGEQLQELIKKEGAKGFVDSGNRIPDGTLTIVGFNPTNTMGEFVKDYKLL